MNWTIYGSECVGAVLLFTAAIMIPLCARPELSPSLENKGISRKTIFDCAVRFHLKDKFCSAAAPQYRLPDVEG